MKNSNGNKSGSKKSGRSFVRPCLILGGLLLAATAMAVGADGAQTAAAAPVADVAVKPQLKIAPAEHFAGATGVKMLAATHAGKRIVAVGDYGVVLLSDDEGKTFYQARSVPVSSTLTAVAFSDADNGWAVGHWGAIIKTTDGGQSWQQQRSDISVDQPLFSVYFKNAQEGWAVGLWSLMLHTTDGGANWTVIQLPPPAGAKKADRNLYSIFGDARGNLFVTSEQGRVLHSSDSGTTWTYAETGYGGSLWTGIGLRDGALLVGGLRGTIYRSGDGGESWQASKTNLKSSVTGIVQRADKGVVAVGLDGLTMVSTDDGASFAGTQREDRAALTAAIDTQAASGVKLFSTQGPVSE
jgi:photosystem II stability/assembly factor-like uncharacterized protein